MIPDKKNVAFSDERKQKKTHPKLFFKKMKICACMCLKTSELHIKLSLL